MTKLRVVRIVIRLWFFIAAVFLVLGGPLPQAMTQLPIWIRKILPQFSLLAAFTETIAQRLNPIANFSEALAQKRWALACYLIAPCVIAALAIWKGRFFCRWVCPAGSAFSLSAALTKKTKTKPWRIIRKPVAPILFWALIGSALVGVTLFLPLDPLSSFNRIAGRSAGWVTWIPGAVLPAFLLLGILQPLAWCAWVCPLGYFFDLLKKIRTQPAATFNSQRRQIIAGLAIGIPVAAVWKKFRQAKPAKAIMPPGSDSTEHFSSTCTRCYACIAACPSGIIKINSSATELDRLFLPTLDYTAGAKVCAEFCNECTKVCPVGAIRTLALEQKQQLQIAQAKIRRKDCIAWGKNEVCAVCDEYCPYSAIHIEYAPDDEYHDIPLPVIDSEKCRGCGYCKKACVAPVSGGAIDMLPVEKQKTIHDSYQRDKNHSSAEPMDG